jgi:hypothetical protein
VRSRSTTTSSSSAAADHTRRDGRSAHSTGTLDQLNPAARRKRHAYGDQVGAARLPARAMSRVAGTDVVIDLVMRPPTRRRYTCRPGHVGDRRRETDTGPVRINRWFVDHSELVLGTVEAGRGPLLGGRVASAPERARPAHCARRRRRPGRHGRHHPRAALDAHPGEERIPRGCSWRIRPGPPVAWTHFPDVAVSRTLTWHPLWGLRDGSSGRDGSAERPHERGEA